MAKEKKIKAGDLRQLSITELNEKVASARKNLLELRLKRSEQKNPLKLRWVRREVARISTIINEKAGAESGKQK